MIICVISCDNLGQMVACFAVFYAMICPKSFYDKLSTSSSPPINPKMTSSISTTNYSPPSSGRGWGRGFVCHKPFDALLSTTSRSQLFYLATRYELFL